MENRGPGNTQTKIGEKSSDSRTNIQANADSKTSPKAQKKTSNARAKKWTLREHWERASSAKRIKWIFEGIGGLVAVLILANYVWQNLQTKWAFGVAQRAWINIDYHWAPAPIGGYNPAALVGLDTTLTNTGKSAITIARGEGVFELIDADKQGRQQSGQSMTSTPSIQRSRRHDEHLASKARPAHQWQVF